MLCQTQPSIGDVRRQKVHYNTKNDVRTKNAVNLNAILTKLWLLPKLGSIALNLNARPCEEERRREKLIQYYIFKVGGVFYVVGCVRSSSPPDRNTAGCMLRMRRFRKRKGADVCSF